MLAAIALFTFASVALGVMAAVRPKDPAIARRIEPATTRDLARERQLEGSFSQRVLAPLVANGGRLVAATLPQNVVRKADGMLVMANEPMSLPLFLVLWALSAAGGTGLFVYAVMSRPGITPMQVIVLAMAGLPFAVLLPYVLLRRRVRMRQQSIVRELPDALDLVVTCVEAGLGVDSAFALVTEKGEGPLTDAFALYLKETGLGRGRREALSAAAERTGVQDLISLAAAVSQGEDLGTTLGDVLRTQSEELRLTRRHRAQEAAQRAPVLMTIPLALCFLPAMAAVVVVPSILNLLDFAGSLGGK